MLTARQVKLHPFHHWCKHCGHVFCAEVCSACEEKAKGKHEPVVGIDTDPMAVFAGLQPDDIKYTSTTSSTWSGVQGCTCSVSLHMRQHNQVCARQHKSIEENRRALEELTRTQRGATRKAPVTY